MTHSPFKFDIGSRVALTESGGTEEGRVVGQARYEDASDGFLIRYRAGDGRQVELWWNENAIAAVTA